MIPPVDPAAVERVAALLDYNGSTGGVADRDVAAMLRALSSALTQATEERDKLKDENEDLHLVAQGIKHYWHCEKNAASGGGPFYCNRCWAEDERDAKKALTTQLAEAHQHLGTALRFVKEAGFDDQIQAARAYYEAHKAT